MAKKLPADERRAQLLEAALTIAAEHGVDALTMRPLAAAAGASLGIVHYHFHDKDTLLTHLGETQILQVNDAMRLAFGQYTEPVGLTGIPALEDLLRAGIRGLWPIIEATPNHQLLTYEITAHALRQRSAGNQSAGAIAQQQYRTMDAQAVAFLDVCARRAGVSWSTPVNQVARFVLACMNGLVLRWLVDRDSDAALATLDDLVQIITTKATDPTSETDAETGFSDDSNFLPIGSPMPAPSTTGVLLNRLKLGSAERATQSTAIAEWLRDHTPSAGLVRSLRRRGFGDLVDGGKGPQP